jgi:hypothetical protein
MRRRSKAGGEQVKKRHRKMITLERLTFVLVFTPWFGGGRMSSDMRLVGSHDGVALGVEAAEHERQFREIRTWIAHIGILQPS